MNLNYSLIYNSNEKLNCFNNLASMIEKKILSLGLENKIMV